MVHGLETGGMTEAGLFWGQGIWRIGNIVPQTTQGMHFTIHLLLVMPRESG